MITTTEVKNMVLLFLLFITYTYIRKMVASINPITAEDEKLEVNNCRFIMSWLILVETVLLQTSLF